MLKKFFTCNSIIVFILILIIVTFLSDSLLIKIHKMGSYFGFDYPLNIINYKLNFTSKLNDEPFHEYPLATFVYFFLNKKTTYFILTNYYVKEKLKIDPFFYEIELFYYASSFYKSIIFNRLIRFSDFNGLKKLYRFYVENRKQFSNHEKFAIIFSFCSYSVLYKKKLCLEYFNMTLAEQTGVWQAMVQAKKNDIDFEFNFFKQICLKQNIELEVELALFRIKNIRDKNPDNKKYSLDNVIRLLRKKYPNSNKILRACDNCEKIKQLH